MLKKLKLLSLLLFLLLGTTLQAASLSEWLEKSYNQVKKQMPGSALVYNQLDLDGPTLSNFASDSGKAYTIVSPNEKVTFSMDFAFDSEEDDFTSLERCVYGLTQVGPIDSIANGLWYYRKEGSLDISFNAPEKKGVYELRVIKVDQDLPIDYHSINWNKTTRASTIGVIVVDSDS